MPDQNGTIFENLAAESGAPQTRAEVDAMIVRAAPSGIVTFVRGWLMLDDEHTQINEQASHVEHVLGDRLLGIMLSERLAEVIATMRRRGLDLARLSSRQPEDIGAKCYVRARLLQLAPDDSKTLKRLCESIRKDVDALGIDVRRLDHKSN